MRRVTIAGVHAREARAGPSLLQTEERGLRRGPFSQTASHADFRKRSGIPALYRHRDYRDKPAEGHREGRRVSTRWMYFQLSALTVKSGGGGTFCRKRPNQAWR